jgi:WD40 repeat protein
VASSADGKKLVAVPNAGPIFTSTNAGVTWVKWVEHPDSQGWREVACSSDGTKIVTLSDGNGGVKVFNSKNSGKSWGISRPPWYEYVSDVASSSNGKKLIVSTYASMYGDSQSRLWGSADSGTTWTILATKYVPEAGDWFGNMYYPHQYVGVASSTDGKMLVAVTWGDFIYTSADSGATWETRASSQNWRAVASSNDGRRLVAVVQGGRICTSTNRGATWVARASVRDWWAVASSADGKKLVATVWAGKIYTSKNSGVTWVPHAV